MQQFLPATVGYNYGYVTIVQRRAFRFDHRGKIRYDSTVDKIRYDAIAEFNVDSKSEYSALSSTRSQRKKL